ncbi:uncharacterized protein LOC131848668 isoform X1 [Achroia grisella]|uniref:uncharacterized protein LOC131848668 isoform X1 n=1 Tax=Achroia grisella TaxID=688607 RepID=UPI0027D2D029|nr:uncharacterized protein LOC131848668 isoform X1 [Achroia grisella]
MEQDELSEFLITKENKKLLPEQEVKSHEPEESIKREPLTTKNAVNFLLAGTLRQKVCRYCLNVATPLYELDRVYQIGTETILYKVTVRDMIASFHPFKVIDEPNFPNRICDKCLNRTFSAYLFTQQCDQSERALRNCFDDIYEKLDKLDPLERPKKRGRQKINPNYNVIYSEHEKVFNYADPLINIINIGTSVDNTSNGYNELQCPRCWQILPNLDSLLNHEKLHPKFMWYNCHICGKSFAKRYQLKRHVRSSHELGKKLSLPDSGFKCTDCGVGSVSYDQHLRHIEKHKFQTVMEHLVHRNMDKLCALCLNKDGHLVELDKTISLHGGHPELTGHKSIYNIVGSTLPEQKSYKYQELLVPNTAKIVTLVKKLTANKQTSVDQERDINTMAETFALPHPIIISVSSVKSDNTLFIFSRPQSCEENTAIELNCQNIEIATSVESCCKNNKTSLYEIENEKSTTNKEPRDCSDMLQTNKNIFTFSEPYFLDIYKKANNTTFTNPEPKISKVKIISQQIFMGNNYVFEKRNNHAELQMNMSVVGRPSSDEFSEPVSNFSMDMINSDKNDNRIKFGDAIKESCKFCWIFTNTEKCEKCRKFNYTNSHNRNNDRNMITKSDIYPNACVDQVILGCGEVFESITNSSEHITTSEADNKKTEPANSIKDLCKFCWFFKNTRKCEYCKICNDNDSMTKAEKISHNVCTNVVKQPTKRKLTDEISVRPMKSKWKCNICLTDNANRLTCLCCDFQNYDYDKVMKVNLGNGKNSIYALMDVNKKNELSQNDINENNDSLNDISNKNEIPEKDIDNKNKSPINFDKLNLILNSASDIIESAKEATSNNLTCQDNFNNTISTETNNLEMETCENTGFFTITFNNGTDSANSNMEIQEEMDIVMDALPIKTTAAIATPKVLYNNTTPTPFQFQIGTGTSRNEGRTRRFIKPLRRMANMS